MKRSILVKSCQKNRARIEACRDTWLGSLRSSINANCGGVRAVVIEGGHEKFAFANSIIFGVGGDKYGDNSQKLLYALRVLLSVGDHFDHLFICDDDTFIHPQRWLEHEPSGELECRLHYPLKSDPDNPIASDHLPALEKQLNYGLPWANGGAGFWMSRRLCQLYTDEVTECCSWDDVLATQVAQRHGVEIIDRPDLYGDDRYGSPSWRVSEDGGSRITCHPVEPAEMREMWESIK